MFIQKLKEGCERWNCGKIISAMIVIVVSVAVISIIGTIIGMLFFQGCYPTTGM
jgi:hypothetical protein